jgi:hypothetical protein
MAVAKRRAWCPYVEKKSRNAAVPGQGCSNASKTSSQSESLSRRKKSPVDYYFRQFPEGCPSCGAAKKWVTFPEIRIPRSLREAAATSSGGSEQGVEQGACRSVLESAAKIATLHLDDVKRFAECAMCHEAWVWREDTKTWLGETEAAARHTRSKTARTVGPR